MSLSTALSIAQSALLSTSKQTSVVSRNVSEANNPDYTRRIALVTSTAPGARSVSIQRAANELLFKSNLKALSALEGQSTVSDGMQRLGLAVNGIDNTTSGATMLGKLQEALQTYSSTPSDLSLAENAVDAARNMARTLNGGTQAIQSFRREMDSEIEMAVTELNNLLGQFKAANDAIVKGTVVGSDVSESLDKRDTLLKQISSIVGISTFTRAGNDMVIMTSDGSTLFETVPRSVTFEPQTAYGAGTPGNSVYIDGIPLQPGNGGNSSAAGRLAGFIQLRDDVAGTMQDQLDEIARGLITTFAETDVSGTLAPRPGLFTWPGAPALPAAGAIEGGLAGVITVNAAYDSDIGGDPTRLRDGGPEGTPYDHNPGNPNSASFSALLISYSDKLEAPMAFDPDAGVGTTLSVLSFSTGAISWFDGTRQQAADSAETKEALAMRTAEALSNVTGVNADNETLLLLDLEHTYQASARLISVIDEMLKSLLAAVG